MPYMYHIETRGDNTVGFKTFLHSRIVAGDVSATADVGCYLLDDGVKFSVLPDAVTIYAEEERQIAALLRKIPAAARRTCCCRIDLRGFFASSAINSS